MFCSCTYSGRPSRNSNLFASNCFSYSMKPSFGSVACLCVFTYSRAFSTEIPNCFMINIMTEVADLDIPIAQWTSTFALFLGNSLLIFR